MSLSPTLKMSTSSLMLLLGDYPWHLCHLISFRLNGGIYINFIVKCVADKYVDKAGENNGHVTCMPEMVVSFIDLSRNDFNNLIQLLASEPKNAKDLAGSVTGADVGRARSYFSAMTAGSFYNRLLPKGSVHFAISTFSLQWLSQVNWLVFNYSTNLI